MGQYETSARSFQFKVTDEARLKELVAGLGCDDDDVQLDVEQADGVNAYRLRARGSIEIDPESGVYSDYDPDDYDHRLMPFVQELQKILPEGEGFVYMESYFDGTASVGAYALVATRDAVEDFDMEDHSIDILNKLLGKETPPKAVVCKLLHIPVAEIKHEDLFKLTDALRDRVPPVELCAMIPKTTKMWGRSLYVWLDCPGAASVLCPRCALDKVRIYPGTGILPAPLKAELEGAEDTVWLTLDDYNVTWCQTFVAPDTNKAVLVQAGTKHKLAALELMRSVTPALYVRAVLMKWLQSNGVDTSAKKPL